MVTHYLYPQTPWGPNFLLFKGFPLKSAGAVVVDDANFVAQEEFEGLSSEEEDIAIAGRFKKDIESYLESLVANPCHLRTLGDVIEAMKADGRKEYLSRGLE